MTIYAMEPLLPRVDEEIRDAALEVAVKSAELAGKTHPVVRDKITVLLATVNSYYSNLIEGNATSISDTMKALYGDLAEERQTRRKQLLGRAHVDVERWIDESFREKHIAKDDVVSREFILDIHKRLACCLDPEDLVLKGEDGEPVPVAPGRLRERSVAVGRHNAPEPEDLPRLLERFQEAYRPSRLHGADKLVAAAASHQRLLWIHPFLDGNGRVCRLFTHAFLRAIQLEGHGLWTMSRGLARHRQEYMAALAQGDQRRRGDLDGRGALSSQGLAFFCRFFLGVCLDQIGFMDSMLDLDGLSGRIEAYARMRSHGGVPTQGVLRAEASHLLLEAFAHGRVERGQVARITGLGAKPARDLSSALVKEGLLESTSHRAPLTLGLPVHVLDFYFPSLAPSIA